MGSASCQGRTVTVENVWVSDTGEGPPLLVLHPGGTDSRAMKMVCAEMFGYRQLLVDRPEH